MSTDPFQDAFARRGTHRRRAELARERDALVERVRSLPGLAGFLRPRPFAELARAAEGGPVVMVNAGRHRCDALVLTGATPLVVPLPCTVEDLRDRVIAFLPAVAAVAEADLDADAARRARLEAREAVVDTLGWLWDTVAEPVLARLGRTAPLPEGVGGPRLWWCPTGLFALLPLHAAGRHGARGGGRETVLDRVVSSYTPTLRALLHTRARGAAPSGPGTRRLVVSLPSTPGWPDLPNAGREADALRERFGRVELLTGDEATSAAVLDALARCSWAHFACHGAQDLARPSRNALILHDRPLSPRELTGLRLDHADLAFLSACETSLGGVTLSNEAISLTSALHLAGYRHVIGTLWSIDDALAPGIAALVYDELAARGTRGAAVALHTATRRVRDRFPHAPMSWASYVHTGP